MPWCCTPTDWSSVDPKESTKDSTACRETLSRVSDPTASSLCDAVFGRLGTAEDDAAVLVLVVGD